MNFSSPVTQHDSSNMDFSKVDIDLDINANFSNFVNLSNFANTTNYSNSGLYDIPIPLAVLLSMVYAIISMATVFGNAMVLWILTMSPQMRTVTNLLIANLAFADIIIGAFAIPFQFQAALLQRWLLPHFMCSFCPTVQVISLNVSILTLVALSLDRHRAITSPLKARPSKMRAKCVIAGIWTFSIAVATPTFVAWNVGQVDGKPFCSPSGVGVDFFRNYNHMLVVIQYFVPLVVVSVAYIHMAIVLSGSGVAEESRSDSERAGQSKQRVIKMLFIVVALFAVCWLPFQLYNILQEIYPAINTYYYINVIWFACHMLAMSNSFYNPIIYAIYGEKFSVEFSARFPICCFWAQRNQQSAPPAATNQQSISLVEVNSTVRAINNGNQRVAPKSSSMSIKNAATTNSTK